MASRVKWILQLRECQLAHLSSGTVSRARYGTIAGMPAQALVCKRESQLRFVAKYATMPRWPNLIDMVARVFTAPAGYVCIQAEEAVCQGASIDWLL